MLGVVDARTAPGRPGRRYLRFAGGRPLIAYTLDALNASGVVERLVVWSDDDDVTGWCELNGLEVGGLAPVGPTPWSDLDIAHHLAEGSQWRGVVGFFHAAWPRRSGASIRRAVSELERQPGGCLASPGDRCDAAIRLYQPQCWSNPAHPPAFGSPLALDDGEAMRVASSLELAEFRQQVEMGRIVLRVRANRQVGSGHLFHCLQLAEELDDLALHFLLVDCDEFVERRLEKMGFSFSRETNLADDLAQLCGPNRNVIVNDVLDTTEAEVLCAKAAGYIVVNIEDLGPGARYADWVVNALYPPREGQGVSVLTGARYATVRNEFRGLPAKIVRKVPERVLLTFGGTDPAGLAERFANAVRHGLPDSVEVVVVLGIGANEVHLDENLTLRRDIKSMAAEMMRADLIVTSAGRTVYEAAATGTPVVVIAQNAREATHSHLGYDSGVIFLGLGPLVDEDHAVSVVSRLLADHTMREELSARLRSSIDHLGAERIAAKLRDSLKGL